jgi:5'(3')-deoxyribonucleotidase
MKMKLITDTNPVLEIEIGQYIIFIDDNKNDNHIQIEIKDWEEIKKFIDTQILAQ